MGIAGIPVSGDPHGRRYGPWVLQLSQSSVPTTDGVYARLVDDLNSDLSLPGTTYRASYNLRDLASIEKAAIYLAAPIRSFFAGSSQAVASRG